MATTPSPSGFLQAYRPKATPAPKAKAVSSRRRERLCSKLPSQVMCVSTLETGAVSDRERVKVRAVDLQRGSSETQSQRLPADHPVFGGKGRQIWIGRLQCLAGIPVIVPNVLDVPVPRYRIAYHPGGRLGVEIPEVIGLPGIEPGVAHHLLRRRFPRSHLPVRIRIHDLGERTRGRRDPDRLERIVIGEPE